MNRLTAAHAAAIRWMSIAALLLASVRPAGAESLDYQVVYRGVFSLGRDLPIADLTLESRQTVPPGLSQTVLRASSAAYDLVERMYPIRYRFRSWARSDNGHLVGLEAYEKTRREKHRLYLRDGASAKMRRLDPVSVEGGSLIDRLQAGDNPVAAVTTPLFDRLGLLFQLRRQPLYKGASYRLSVTNGRELLRYRVRVVSASAVEIGRRKVPAWKLRFDAVEFDEDARAVPAHRPVYIWFSRDADKTPLRADVRHAIGLFRVEWVESEAREQLALGRPRRGLTASGRRP